MARDEKIKTELGQRLRDIRSHFGDPDREVFCLRLGISKGSLGNYERGDRVPDSIVLQSYRSELGVDANWLLTGEGQMFTEEHSSHENPTQGGGAGIAVQSSDMISLQRYDIQAAAGDGIIPVSENAEDSGISIARAFLRRIGAHPNSCILLESKGDSMLPSIPGGSLLVVDRSKTEIEDDMVFVFRVGPGIKVKRAVWRIDGNLDLVSDNEKYPPETYGPDRADEIAPIGQVMLVLRHP